jgi:hypothetical protein
MMCGSSPRKSARIFPLSPTNIRPSAGKFLTFGFQFLGRGRFHGAVVPKQIDCRPGTFGGELEADDTRVGKGIVVFDFDGHVAD